MQPLIDGEAIVGILVDSTTGYLVIFAPVFLLMGGIILGYYVGLILLGFFFPERGYAPGEYMASIDEMTDDDRAYYRSRQYPGNYNRGWMGVRRKFDDGGE